MEVEELHDSRGKAGNDGRIQLEVFGNRYLTLIILSNLGNPRDILSLAKTRKLFSKKEDRHGGERWSVAEEGARRHLVGLLRPKDATDTHSCLRRFRNESWMAVLYKYFIYQKRDIYFGLSLGRTARYAGEDNTTLVMQSEDGCGVAAVASNYVMQGGVHSLMFYPHHSAHNDIHFGLIRPLSKEWQRRHRGNLESFSPFDRQHQNMLLQMTKDTCYTGDSDRHCVEYICNVGATRWTSWDEDAAPTAAYLAYCDYLGVKPDVSGTHHWIVNNSALKPGGESVGLRLDLEDGTLQLWLNDKRVGIICDKLAGEYCWFMSTYSKNICGVNTEKR